MSNFESTINNSFHNGSMVTEDLLSDITYRRRVLLQSRMTTVTATQMFAALTDAHQNHCHDICSITLSIIINIKQQPPPRQITTPIKLSSNHHPLSI